MDNRIRSLERTLAASPGDAATRLLLARELGRLGKREAATAHVEQVLRDDPLSSSGLEALDENGLSPLAAKAPWPTIHGGNDGARRSSFPGARQGKRARQIRIGVAGRGDVEQVKSLTVGDGVAFLATDQRRLIALDLATGAPRWIRDFPHPFAAPTIGAGERLALASLDTVRLLDGRTGETLWIARSPGVLEELPAVATFAPRGLVLAPGIRGALYALDAATGKLRWSVGTRGALYGAPIVLGKTIHYACSYGWLVALDLEGRETARARFDSWAPNMRVAANEEAFVIGSSEIPLDVNVVARGAKGAFAFATRLASQQLGCAIASDRWLASGKVAIFLKGSRRELSERPLSIASPVADSASCFYGWSGEGLGWFDATGGRVKTIRDVESGPIVVGPDSTLLVPSSRGLLQEVR